MGFVSPIYPLDNISDVPARVAASEITREKLHSCHRLQMRFTHRSQKVFGPFVEDLRGLTKKYA